MKKVESHLKRDIGLAKKETLKRFAEAKKKLVMAEKHAEEYVEKNPKKAVAIAVGVGAAVGAILGYLIKRKK